MRRCYAGDEDEEEENVVLEVAEMLKRAEDLSSGHNSYRIRQKQPGSGKLPQGGRAFPVLEESPSKLPSLEYSPLKIRPLTSPPPPPRTRRRRHSSIEDSEAPLSQGSEAQKPCKRSLNSPATSDNSFTMWTQTKDVSEAESPLRSRVKAKLPSVSSPLLAGITQMAMASPIMGCTQMVMECSPVSVLGGSVFEYASPMDPNGIPPAPLDRSIRGGAPYQSIRGEAAARPTVRMALLHSSHLGRSQDAGEPLEEEGSRNVVSRSVKGAADEAHCQPDGESWSALNSPISRERQHSEDDEPMAFRLASYKDRRPIRLQLGPTSSVIRRGWGPFHAKQRRSLDELGLSGHGRVQQFAANSEESGLAAASNATSGEDVPSRQKSLDAVSSSPLFLDLAADSSLSNGDTDVELDDPPSPSTPSTSVFMPSSLPRECPFTPQARGREMLSRNSSLNDTKILGTTMLKLSKSVFTFNLHFKYLREIGRGSSSQVYAVEDTRNHGHFAVKKSKRQFQNREQREHFLHELQSVASLTEHPNVVKYYQSWQQDSYFYIQMELCEGGNLADYLKKSSAQHLAEEKIWSFARQVAAGLHHIHAAGVVHLDVKPENIYLTEDFGLLKIGDFGLAVLTGQWDWEEGDGAYVAPELLVHGTHRPLPGPASDMFSFGAMLYEWSTGSQLPRSGPLRQGLQLELPTGRSAVLADLIRQLLNPIPSLRPTAVDVLYWPSRLLR
eukprot:TRINITY_DN3145_c0_g1_i2.p1 TRINITY_DN3145_c0_g1~~TRINITY_DN3145_c0_g1_i2.p1  ORF type:complete len:726 (-),score=105.10 TRINITY_DN3145_c0_g1_i2:2935-5112(-)